MTEHHYIYLLQEREFFNNKDNVYKLGKTTQELVKRFSGYPKGTVIILTINVISSDESETHLLEIFREKFVSRNDYGTEHFQGDLMEMIKILHEHQLEQIELTRNDAVVPPPIVKYENTVIEFLEKRTLPMVYGDSRIPVTSNVEFQVIAQFYREWCKENKKRALVGAEVIKTHVNKFLENWLRKQETFRKRNRKVTIFYKVNIYNKDPEFEDSRELEYRPTSWVWHFTSSIDEIDEGRTLISPKTGFHLSNKLELFEKDYSGFKTVLDKERWGELKCYTRIGWHINMVVYSEYMMDCGLVIERPAVIQLEGYNRCSWHSRDCNCGECSSEDKMYYLKLKERSDEEARAIRNSVKLSGGTIIKTWLSENGQNPGLVAKFGETKIFIPYLGIIGSGKILPVDIISQIWSGPIIFHIKGYIKNVDDKFIGWGLKHTWGENTEIYDVYFLENQLVFKKKSGIVLEQITAVKLFFSKYLDEGSKAEDLSSEETWIDFTRRIYHRLSKGRKYRTTKSDRGLRKCSDEEIFVLKTHDCREDMINNGVIPPKTLTLRFNVTTIGKYSVCGENIPKNASQLFEKMSCCDFIKLIGNNLHEINSEISVNYLQDKVLSDVEESNELELEEELIDYLKETPEFVDMEPTLHSKLFNNSFLYPGGKPADWDPRRLSFNTRDGKGRAITLIRKSHDSEKYIKTMKAALGAKRFQQIYSDVKKEIEITLDQ